MTTATIDEDSGQETPMELPTPSEIENRFTYHAPTTAQIPLYESNRARAREYAGWLVANIPPSRELSLALTNLEQVVMWSNAAVARRS